MTTSAGGPEKSRSEGAKMPFKIHHLATLENIRAGQRAILGSVALSWAATTPMLGHRPLKIGNRR